MSIVKNMLKRKPTALIAILVTAAALAFLFVFVFMPALSRSVRPNGFSAQAVEDAVVVERHPLTGLPVTHVEEDPQVYGVMIDNHVDAWPPAGLDQSFLVYEAPVEGGITRFLAFYYEGQDVEKIGPVRSARPYFLDWNNELDALYTHVGGSNAALDLIASGGTFDLNEYWHTNSFWRALNRYAPHNTYTSTERLSAFVAQRVEQQKWERPLYEHWLFQDTDLTTSGDVHTLKITYDTPVYVIGWTFHASTHQYERTQAGKEHTTESGEPILADNVIVVEMDVEVLDAVGRRRVDTIGTGRARVHQNGFMTEGTWQKESQSQRTRFFDVHGQEIVLNAGRAWVEIVPSLEMVSL